ncbi:hypothetical protein L6452_17744 [Arctium lappa]|uniref:Uncharacterized protein n=1 Tax=Arctium lappa TaxID=4217 RepID=A0ACB9C4G8_ARCLA|nr:hypothetical protein L6452_17744 [Arctium lappa]
MTDEFHNSNPLTLLLGAPHDITNQNPTTFESVFTGSWGSNSSSSVLNTSFGSDLDSTETERRRPERPAISTNVGEKERRKIPYNVSSILEARFKGLWGGGGGKRFPPSCSSSPGRVTVFPLRVLRESELDWVFEVSGRDTILSLLLLGETVETLGFLDLSFYLSAERNKSSTTWIVFLHYPYRHAPSEEQSASESSLPPNHGIRSATVGVLFSGVPYKMMTLYIAIDLWQKLLRI